MNTLRNVGVLVLIAVIAVVAVVYFIRQISRNPILSGPPTPTPIARNAIQELKLTAQGPIVANEQYVTEVLDITPTQRSLVANITYTGQLVTSQTLSNNADAYSQLLGALLDAGFTQASHGRNNPASAASTCPQGIRFTYDAGDGSGNNLSSLWATTCATSNETMAGNVQLVNQLMRAQFPNITTLNQQFPVLQPLSW